MAVPTPTADDRCTARRPDGAVDPDDVVLSISEPSSRPVTDPRTDPAAEAASRFALALAEVLAGRRPASQLRPLSCPSSIAELIRVQTEWPFTGARLHSLHIGASASAGSCEVVACYRWRPGGGAGVRLVCTAFRMTRIDDSWSCRELTIGVPNLGR